jgi:hypothetical protein
VKRATWAFATAMYSLGAVLVGTVGVMGLAVVFGLLALLCASQVRR